MIMDVEHEMKVLNEKRDQLTTELNDKAIAHLSENTVKELFPFVLEEGSLQLVEIVDTEAKIRQQMHLLMLSQVADAEECFSRLIQQHEPSPAERTKRVRASLEQVCDVIRTRHGMFVCELVGVGSHHDGTKMFCHDEMDFVFVLKHRANVDYRVTSKSEDLLDYAICPVKEFDLYRCCLDKGLLKEDEIDISQYRYQFIDVLESVIPEVCASSGLHFGGWNRPYFGGFLKNGPAVTFVVDGVSVDISMAWRAPEGVMERFKECSDVADSWRVLVTTIPDYTTLGLLVIADDDADGCVLSASLIETKLFQSNPVLHQALQLCKVYKDKLFNLPWPDMSPLCRYLDGRMFQWLLDTLPTKDNQATQIVQEFMAKGEGMVELLLATKRRPLTVERRILDQIEAIHQMCGHSFTGNNYEGSAYPSLQTLLDEVNKPIAKATSFVFKCLILEEWLQAQNATTKPSDMPLSQIMLQDCHGYIYHPLLNYPVYLVSIHNLCRFSDIQNTGADIYCKNVDRIVSFLVDSAGFSST